MKKQTAFWRCKDGHKLRICDMQDRHLTNTIKMLRRLARRELLSTPYPIFDGEMAQMYAEQEFDRLLDADGEELADEFYPIHKKLMADYRRRGLPEDALDE